MFPGYLVTILYLTISVKFALACENLESITLKENLPYPSQNLLDIFNSLKRNNVINYDRESIYLTDSTGSRPFSMTKGNLIVTGPLDREQICHAKTIEQRISISRCCGSQCCMYIGVTHPGKNEYIKVIIEDENDNEPSFPQQSLKKLLNENVKIGFSIAIPKAIDSDSDIFGIDKYELVQDRNCGDCFQVKSDPQDGSLAILTKVNIDREIHAVFHLQVLAIDKGVSAKTGTLSVTIEVVDINDNAPRFEEASTTLTVNENGIPGRKVQTIKVRDADYGDNSKMTYEIEDYTLTAQKHFRLLPERDGVSLLLLTTLDYESSTEFRFKIIAKDQGYPSLSSSIAVNIQVVNINDELPEIVFYKRGQALPSDNIVLHLPENGPKQQTIVSVHVTDRDSKMADITCEVSNPRDVFFLHENQQPTMVAKKKLFELQNSLPFDREITSLYQIRISCSDSNSDIILTQSAAIQLRIEDKNDNHPMFSSNFYFGKIVETNLLDKLVDITDGIKVTDEDIDMNSRIKYSLVDVGNSTDSQKFNIGSNDPRIKNIAPIDYEEKKRYVFLVVANDCGVPSLSATATITINVLDANDNKPEIVQKVYSFSVLEEQPMGTEIGQITATDADSDPRNRDFIYEIVSQDGVRDGSRPNKQFIIENNTGRIKTRLKLDHEKDQNVNFLVRVRNSNDNILFPDKSDFNGDSVSVSVRIVDINDNSPKLVLKDSQHPNAGLGNETPKRLEIEINSDVQTATNPCVHFPYTFSDADAEDNAAVKVTLKDSAHFALEMGHSLICPKNENIAPGLYTVYVLGEDRNGGNGSRRAEYPINIVVKSSSINTSKVPQKSPRLDPDEKLGDYKAVIIFIVLIVAIVLFCLLLMIVVVKTKLCIPRNAAQHSRSREKMTEKQNNTGSNKNYNIIMSGGDCENKRLYSEYVGNSLNNQTLINPEYSKNLFYPQSGSSQLDFVNFYQNQASPISICQSKDYVGTDQSMPRPHRDAMDTINDPEFRYEQLQRSSDVGPEVDQSKVHQYNYLIEPREAGSIQSNSSKGIRPKHDLVAVAAGYQKSIHDVYLQTSFV